MAFAAPEIVSVRQALPPETSRQIKRGLLPASAGRAAPVGRYEKLELHIDLRATYTNPYNPDELDLWAEFTGPSGKVWKIWGFYNPSSWASLWMVRFAPPETGRWRYVVKVRDRQGTAESKPGEIDVTPSSHHGFLRIGGNKRYLQYEDGTPFYGIGLWYNDQYEQFDQGAITEEGLDNLKRQGANFISFFHSPLETTGTGLGRYDENRAGRLDQVFEWCEQRDMHISWNIWFHSHISEAVWGKGNAWYRNSPYRQIVPAGQFFTSDEAWMYQERLHRYIIARWGYSRALFLWFLIDEINGTEGWTKGGQAGAEKWSRRVHDFFKTNDPYGRPTTGTRSGGVDEWWPEGYEIFDVAAREMYELQGHPAPGGGKPDLMNANPLRFSYRNYVKQSQALWKNFEKPAIIGESGYDHTYYEPGTPGYLATYHNSLWASLASGLSMTPFWWSYSAYINDSVLTRSMRYFSQFVRDIDFAGSEWTPVALTMSAGDGWAMQGERMTFGWAVNTPGGAANETFTIPGLPDGEYDVRLYRTWRGEYLPPIAAKSAGGVLKVKIPELSPDGGRVQNIGDDVAFKIVKRGIETTQR